jgi:SAM-dependent methyltransferase
MGTPTSDEIREAVREAYGAVAKGAQQGCCGGGSAASCCGPAPISSRQLGYSDDDLAAVPGGADLGLGCGNPQAVAALKPGERVLDLGSGAGFDAFLAARQVGLTGFVIGVDMTPAMIERARANAVKAGSGHVEFRLGQIEALPVDDASVDVILSNCVINLAPDKAAVFREAFRVLVPGGRLAISDIVALRELPPALASDLDAYTGCIAGAAPVAQVRQLVADAGFTNVRVTVQPESRSVIEGWSPGSGAERYVASALIEATKPA